MTLLKPEQLHAYQRQAVAHMWAYHWSMLWLGMGLGKEQPNSEPVLTPNGFVPMGTLRIGDHVIGANGHPTEVIGVYPQGLKEIVKITFSDGSSTRCGWDHLWNVKTNKQRFAGAPWQTMTTRELKDSLSHRVSFSIPMCSAVHAPDVELPMCPYTMGVFLGDGHTSKCIVMICTDLEIINKCESIGTMKPHDTSSYTWYGSIIGKRQVLRDLGLVGKRSWEKFIPAIYFTGSAEQRLKLLQGLMDTDGSALRDGGGTEFSSTSYALIEGVVTLAQSLGGIAKVKGPRVTRFQGGEGRPSWRVNVKLPSHMEPFTLTRKLANWTRPTKYPVRRYVRTIEPCGYEEATCIKVAASDHLYVTKDYIVTHNTSVTLTSIVQRMKYGQVNKTLIFGPLRVVQTVWEREARKWEHTQHLTFSVMCGTKQDRERALFRDADIYLTNYENMNWLAQELDHYYIGNDDVLPFQMVVYDECFVAGTLISTVDGLKPIEDIKVGDFVLTHLGKKPVTDVILNSVFSLVSVKLSNGIELKTTGEHPFLVRDEWVTASNLKIGDELHHESQYTKVRSSGLRNMRRSILEKKRVGKVLLSQLCKQMAKSATLHGQSIVGEIRCQTGRVQSQARDLEQRNTAYTGSPRKDVSSAKEKYRKQIVSEWRQRVRRVKVRESFAHDAARKLHNRMHGVKQAETGGVSYPLQAGLRRPGTETRNRGAGQQPQIYSRARKGREEAREIERVWVEDIVHHEQRCAVPVWNLSVLDAETYFAGGVLVHNCSKLKNSTALRMKGGNRDKVDRRGDVHKVKIIGWRKMVDQFKYRVGLTGTPASNGYLDLHGQFLAVDGGERLGQYVTGYRDAYFQSDYMGWSYKPTDLGKQYIESKISDITLKMDAKDYLDLPAVKVTDLMVDLPDAARRAYIEMEKKMFAELDSGAAIEVFSQNSISNKLLQMTNGSPYLNSGTDEYESLHDAKLDALEDVLEEAGGSPVLCSYTYKPDAERIMKRFKKYKPVNLTQVKSKDTGKVIDDWNSGKIKLLVGHPASCSHGLDGLQQSGHIIVWFGCNWSLELYEQLNARIDRQGQKKAVSIIRILCRDSVDLAVADALERKTDDQEGLKAAIQRYRAKMKGEISFL